MIDSPVEAEELARMADQQDMVYLVPAFTGLGAPYWDSQATAGITGMTRTTGKAEIVRAALDCIAYQITDVVKAMCEDVGNPIKELRVDGGPTRNEYLMQFQSDIMETPVRVPEIEELSGTGAAYMTGLAMGIYQNNIFKKMKTRQYTPEMEKAISARKYQGWKTAVKRTLS